MKKIILFTSLVLFLVSCNCNKKDDKANKGENATENPVAKANAEYLGIYEGVLPCADCPGIKTTLELSESAYKLTQEYLESDEPVENLEGNYSIDESTKKITLQMSGTPMLFKYDNGKVKMLSADGQEVTGELANNYILQKK